MLTDFNTKLGHMALATLAGEVVGLVFGYPTGGQARKPLADYYTGSSSTMLRHAATDTSPECAHFHEHVASLLERFADGEPVDFLDVPILLAGLTDFQRKVVAACRASAWGETVTYGDLARAVGRPGAARAVGTVMRKNRVPLIVPCHRVLACGGRLGGYSSPSGLDMKRRLLALEKHEQLAGVV